MSITKIEGQVPSHDITYSETSEHIPEVVYNTSVIIYVITLFINIIALGTIIGEINASIPLQGGGMIYIIAFMCSIVVVSVRLYILITNYRNY
jgi:hypothetical protein